MKGAPPPATAQRQSKVSPLPLADLAIAGLIALVLGAVYLLTLAPTVLAADGGEFQFAAYLGGIAHPTGYPLYLILGWVWSHLLPFGDPAFRMNLFSTFWAALAVGTLYLLTLYHLRRLGTLSLASPLNRPVAALGAVTLGVSEIFWSQAVAAEVYSLHAFFTAAILFTALAWDEAEGRERVGLLLALLVGCSLAHHGTAFLLLPGLLAFLWLRRRRSPQNQKAIYYVKLGLLLLLPQLLYLYIPLRAPHTPYLTLPWTPDGPPLALYENSLQGFLHFRLGQVFAGELRYGAETARRLALAGQLLVRQFTALGVLLGLAGLAYLARKRQVGFLLLTFLLYAGQAAFNLFYLIGDIEAFFIPTYLVFAIWIALGIGGLLEVLLNLLPGLAPQPAQESAQAPLPRSPRPGVQWLGSLILLPLTLLPSFLTWENLPRVDLSSALEPRRRWEAFLGAGPPSQAIVVSNDRNEIMPLWYLQYVEGRRPDLTGIFPLVTQEPRFANVGRLLEAALATGRPVLLAKPMPGLEVRFTLQEEGRFWRVVAPIAVPNSATRTEATLGDSLRLLGYEWRPSNIPPGSVLEVALYWQPCRQLPADYTVYVHLVTATGERILGSDHRPGGDYYPTSLWEADDILRDLHRLSLPQSLPRGPYRLRVGAYLYPEMAELGKPLWLGPVQIQ